jgi:hypothetical protein
MEKIQRKQKSVDAASAATILVTIVLFIIAIFEKGFTHELLLEAGVFLVSVKLILSSVKFDLAVKKIETQLDEIKKKIA